MCFRLGGHPSQIIGFEVRFPVIQDFNTYQASIRTLIQYLELIEIDYY